MSCFKGKMLEYQYISLDRFDGFNLNSYAYFLSHCHEDHTQGLKAPAFYQRLQKSSDIFLYCSDVTKLLLKEHKDYKHLLPFIKALPENIPKIISIPDSDSCKYHQVTVTLIPAAHCPGSVMFLFEGTEGTALYTGDFRWEAEEIKTVKAFHESNSRVKTFQSIYVDTTFCHPDTYHIPGRRECAEATCQLVKEWVTQGPNYMVVFRQAAKYGHEHLMREISIDCKMQIHVTKAKFDVYEQIQELKGRFTTDPQKSQIHACSSDGRFYYDELPCGYMLDEVELPKLMVVAPSTMWFRKKLALTSKDIVVQDKRIFRVCYSFHSSYSEVMAFIKYLSPQRVRPNVKPQDDEDIYAVQKRINQFLNLNMGAIGDALMQKELGKLQRPSVQKRHISASSDSESLVFDEGSPEKRLKKNAWGASGSPQDGIVTTPVKALQDSQSSYSLSIGNDSEMSETGLLNGQGDQEISLVEHGSFKILDSLQSCSQEVSSCRVLDIDDNEQGCGGDSVDVADMPDIDEEVLDTIGRTGVLQHFQNDQQNGQGVTNLNGNNVVNGENGDHNGKKVSKVKKHPNVHGNVLHNKDNRKDSESTKKLIGTGSQVSTKIDIGSTGALLKTSNSFEKSSNSFGHQSEDDSVVSPLIPVLSVKPIDKASVSIPSKETVSCQVIKKKGLIHKIPREDVESEDENVHLLLENSDDEKNADEDMELDESSLKSFPNEMEENILHNLDKESQGSAQISSQTNPMFSVKKCCHSLSEQEKEKSVIGKCGISTKPCPPKGPRCDLPGTSKEYCDCNRPLGLNNTKSSSREMTKCQHKQNYSTVISISDSDEEESSSHKNSHCVPKKCSQNSDSDETCPPSSPVLDVDILCVPPSGSIKSASRESTSSYNSVLIISDEDQVDGDEVTEENGNEKETAWKNSWKSKIEEMNTPSLEELRKRRLEYFYSHSKNSNADQFPNSTHEEGELLEETTADLFSEMSGHENKHTKPLKDKQFSETTVEKGTEGNIGCTIVGKKTQKRKEPQVEFIDLTCSASEDES